MAIMNTLHSLQISRTNQGALTGVVQWAERRPTNQKVTGSIASQGTRLGFRPSSHMGAYERQLINECFSLSLMFLSLSFSLPSL